METGVYMIRNAVNGKVYVGSAATSFKARWRVHLCHLRANKHHSVHLQRAWNKYGETAFEFVIIEACLPENCVNREQHWIDFHKSYGRQFGYNISPTAGSVLGKKCRAETRAKIAAITGNTLVTAGTLAKLWRKHRDWNAVADELGIDRKTLDIRRYNLKLKVGRLILRKRIGRNRLLGLHKKLGTWKAVADHLEMEPGNLNAFIRKLGIERHTRDWSSVTAEELTSLFRQHGSWGKVAAFLNTTAQVIYPLRKKLGLPTRKYQSYDHITAAELQGMYARLGSWTAVASELDTGDHVVWQLRRRHGL